MAQSFTLTRNVQNYENPKRRKVLVTGAAGNIGTRFAKDSGSRYELRLMVKDQEEAQKIEGLGETVIADLLDLERMKSVCQDIDTVLHLAGNPSPNATWTELLEANIIGTYNTFVAAKSAGCRRVVYASSIHAVSGYPADVQVKTTDPVNPGDLYGVSKCFGEALGRYMAEQESLSIIALRIGAFQPLEAAEKEEGVAMMDAFASHRDLVQLIHRSIDNEDIRFAIFHGLSDNRFKRLDISDAKELLGYAPIDDLTEVNPQLKPLHLSETVNAHSQQDESAEAGIREEVS